MVEGLGRVFSSYSLPRDSSSADTLSAETGVSQARQITEQEARWLAARLDRDRVLHENEKALLTFLKEKATSIHPALQPALDKVAATR